MTSPTAQIQALINEIDAVLNKSNPRLPWVMSGEAAQQRQVLEQTRSYLASLQQQLVGLDFGQLQPGMPGFAPPSPLEQYAQAQVPAAESAQQVLQAVLQEMSYLRSNVMQPLRTDLETLRQQRESLQQEIRQLEAQRQQYALPSAQANQQMLNEFLQTLMVRLREDLSQQMGQMLVSVEAQQLPEARSPEAIGSTNPPLLDPAQRLEQLQALQSQSDQLLLKLDSTLSVIFQSLQTNVQSYQESLQGGLEQMHSLGQQGEAMFAAFINRLAQQLGREASSYLQSSAQSGDWQTANRALLGTDAIEDLSLRSLQPSTAEDISEAQIDLFLNELDAIEPPPAPLSVVSEPADQNLLNLDLANLTLELPVTPDLPVDLDEDLTLFQMDVPFTSSEDDEITVFQTEFAHQPAITPTPSQMALDAGLETVSRDAVSSTQPPAEATTTEPNLAATEASYDEIDEFYESLFGDGEPADTSLTDAASQSIAPPAAQLELPTPEPANLPADVDLEVALFEGLSDPAQGTDEVAQSELANQPPPEASSLESFLFAPDPESLEPPADTSTELQSDFLEVESIASLSDLIPDQPEAGTPEEPSLQAQSPEQEVSSPSEESYIPAAPDEDLLALEDPEDRAGLDLRLDPTTYEQLTADLSSLEGLEEDLFEPQPSEIPLDLGTDDAERTLALEPDSPYQHPYLSTPELPTEPEPSADAAIADLFDFSETPESGNVIDEPLPETSTDAAFDELFDFTETPAASADAFVEPSLETPTDTAIDDLFGFTETSESVIPESGNTIDEPLPETATDTALDELFDFGETPESGATIAEPPPETATDAAIDNLFDFNLTETPESVTPESADVIAEASALDELFDFGETPESGSAIVEPPPETATDAAIDNLFDFNLTETPESVTPEPADVIAEPSALDELFDFSETPQSGGAITEPESVEASDSVDLADALFDFGAADAPETATEVEANSIDDLFDIPLVDSPEAAEPDVDAAEIDDLFSGEPIHVEEPQPNAEGEDLFDFGIGVEPATTPETAELTLEDFAIADAPALIGSPDDPFAPDLDNLFAAEEPTLEPAAPADAVSPENEALLDELFAAAEAEPLSDQSNLTPTDVPFSNAEAPVIELTLEDFTSSLPTAPAESADSLEDLFTSTEPQKPESAVMPDDPDETPDAPDLPELGLADFAEAVSPTEPAADAVSFSSLQETSAAELDLDDLFASTEQPATAAPAAESALEPGLRLGATEPSTSEMALSDDSIDDLLFAQALEVSDVPEPSISEPLTLDDFAQDVLPSQLNQESTEDLFGSSELEELLSEAPTENLTPPTAASPVEDQATFADLLFFDEATSGQEALAPEEEGLTLDSFAQTTPSTQSDADFSSAFDNFPGTTAESAAPDDATLEDLLFGDLPQPSSGLETPTVPEAIAEPTEPSESLPLEANTFTLEGLDSLFEDLSAESSAASSAADPFAIDSEPEIETNLTLESAFADLEQSPAPESESEDQKKK